MGWKCNDCKNSVLFIELNKVETIVIQEKNSTRIIKTLNKTTNNPLINIQCNKCGSSDVKWVEVFDQDDSYQFNQNTILSENHTISTLVFELTNQCDINCIYCPKKGVKELDFKIVKRLIAENLKLKYPIRHFEFGWDMGNPLLHTRIKDIIKLFNEFECNVNILTNGKNFIDIVKNLNIVNQKFTFFLDYSSQEENDRLMGEGVFNNTIKAFEYLNKNHIDFSVYMRLNKYNYDKIEDMQKLIEKYESNLIPTEVYPLGKTKIEMLMTDDMKKHTISEITRLNLSKSIHFSPALLNRDCTYQRKLRLSIDSEGMLSFCHFLSSIKKSKIVNVRNKHLLELIQINHKIRDGFLKNKTKLFSDWKLPRESSSPCSYCLHSFGINEKW